MGQLPAVLKILSTIAVLVINSTNAPVLLSAEPRASQAKQAKRSVDLTRAPVVLKGLAYLTRAQRRDGGWASDNVSAVSDLSTTSIAGLAFLRSGGSMCEGSYAKVLANAEVFVSNAVLVADDATLLRPRAGDPLVQADLGAGVDAILSAWFLAELLARGVPKEAEQRVKTNLERLLRFMATPEYIAAMSTVGSKALSLALASRVFEIAVRSGFQEQKEARRRLVTAAIALRESKGQGAAGFYESAAIAGTLHASRAFFSELPHSDAFIRSSNDPDRNDMSIVITQSRAKQSLATVCDQIEGMVIHPSWGGMGTAGGEIFLATMLIGDVLHGTGNGCFRVWTQRITHQLARAQNADGSWVGSSCINGRVFCTSAAILALLNENSAETSK